MANQRKKGVSRITVTLPDDLLARIEAEAERRGAYDPGFDRLGFIREALIEKLTIQVPKSGSNEIGDD